MEEWLEESSIFHEPSKITNEQAKKILYEELTDIIEVNKDEIIKDFCWRKYILPNNGFHHLCFSFISFIFCFVSLILNCVNGDTKWIMHLIHLVLFVLLIGVNFYVQRSNFILDHLFKNRKIRAHLEYFYQYSPTEDGKLKLDLNNDVMTLRNNIWQYVPANLLVKGDVVLVPHTKKPPPFAERLCSTFTSTTPRKLAYLHVLRDTPAKQQLELALKRDEKESFLPFAKYIRLYISVGYPFLYLSLFSALLINVIRFILVGDSSQYVEKLFERQVPIVFLGSFALLTVFHLIVLLITCYGDALILATFEIIQNNPKIKEEFDQSRKSREILNFAPRPLILKYFKLLLFNTSSVLARSNQLMVKLGSVTVLPCMDREGLLVQDVPQPEKIYLHKPAHLENGGNSVTLGLTTDSSTMTPTFQNVNWENYIDSLKPIGLNALLNTHCRIHPARQHFYSNDQNGLLEHFATINRDYTHPYNSCLCFLGKEIGFQENALDQFKVLKRIHTFCKRDQQIPLGEEFVTDPPYMHSVVFGDPTHTSQQLLSKGHMGIILHHCDSYWDGEQLCELTEGDKQVILAKWNKWERENFTSVGFAYQPIDGNEAGNNEKTILTVLPNTHLNTTICCKNEDHDSLVEFSELSNRHQIFIGIIAIRDHPKKDVANVIEILRQGGIRFVYFTSENQKNSVLLANQLGLETDWNFIISLKDPDEEKGESPLMDSLSKLPRGISQIRKHLRDIDNVPLLVPIFSDCSIFAKEEMIKILKENQEIVLAVGSSTNSYSIQPFIAADISVAIQPLQEHCLRDGENNESDFSINFNDNNGSDFSINFKENKESLEMQSLQQHPVKLSSSNFRIYNTSGSFSADLTSLPCSFIMHNTSHFSIILDLLMLGRHLLLTTFQCLIFFVNYHFSLLLLLLFGYLFFLPAIISPYQAIWLLLVSGPLLSVSIIPRLEQPKLAKLIPSKNMIDREAVHSLVKICAFSTMIKVILTLCIFLLTFCHFDLNFATDIFYREHQLGLLVFSQHIACFVFSLFLTITCINFMQPTSTLFRKKSYSRGSLILLLLHLFLSLAFFFVSLVLHQADFYLLFGNGFLWKFLVSLCCALALLASSEEFLKRRYKKWYWNKQLELKLDFDTKLGLFSPK